MQNSVLDKAIPLCLCCAKEGAGVPSAWTICFVPNTSGPSHAVDVEYYCMRFNMYSVWNWQDHGITFTFVDPADVHVRPSLCTTWPHTGDRGQRKCKVPWLEWQCDKCHVWQGIEQLPKTVKYNQDYATWGIEMYNRLMSSRLAGILAKAEGLMVPKPFLLLRDVKEIADRDHEIKDPRW